MDFDNSRIDDILRRVRAARFMGTAVEDLPEVFPEYTVEELFLASKAVDILEADHDRV